VLEAATLFAGPLAATFLGDFGADVTKIEHPLRPDAARGHGASKDGVGLWFKTLGRNKRLVTLDLSRPAATSSWIWSAPTTCWWRTSARARWNAGASAQTYCSRRTRGW
jgi:hypothetical protein